MKNFKKNYVQPIFSVVLTLTDVVLASGLGVGDYNINWLGQQERGGIQ